MHALLDSAPAKSWLLLLTLLLAFSCGGEKEKGAEPPAECPAGQSRCGELCVELQTDPAHCGACDRPCAPEERCEAGSCLPACEAPRRLCDGACVDPEEDPAHCGGCGTACPEGIPCEAGSCRRCGAEELLCGESCVDPRADRQNCGGCGTACAAHESCTQGVCIPICGEAEAFCGGACVDPLSEVAHCGACNRDCAALPNVREALACDAGVCVFSCAEGFDACGSDWTKGCDTALAITAAHCGRCGNDCGDRPNVEAASCAEARCRVERCRAGWEDCDEDGENGCETKTATDLQNCGACGRACPESAPNASGFACLEGSCAPVCDEGFGDCDGDADNGCEQPLDVDVAHCGACNTQCHSCKTGVCERIVASAAGIGFNCVGVESGPVYCWGSHAYSLVGADTGGDPTRPSPVPNLWNVRQLAAGPTHLCALSWEGEVWCVGLNGNGQLGNGDTEDQRVPVRVPGLSGIRQIATSLYHTCAIDEEGSAYCWGYNPYGQIGDGSTEPRLTPYKIPDLKDFVFVGTGIHHTCAIQRSGTMFCWGDNRMGLFGDGTRESSLTPKQNHQQFDYAKMDGGWFHSCFLTKNEVVYCSGFPGLLGTGEEEASDVPLEVKGLPEVVDIAVNRNASCARTAGGQLYCWGSNEEQELGMDVEHLPTPALVPGLEGVESVHFGYRELTCAVTREKGLHCWGLNGDARLRAEAGAAGSIEPIHLPF